MGEGPKWGEVDAELYEGADQMTGKGVRALVKQMAERVQGGEATGFEWHADQGTGQQQSQQQSEAGKLPE